MILWSSTQTRDLSWPWNKVGSLATTVKTDAVLGSQSIENTTRKQKRELKE